ncbi:MAG: hypothetical protein JNK05_28080 [Myxococcales bacterium]|nr:hypothetical protein [Myxococcales bacterium]
MSRSLRSSCIALALAAASFAPSSHAQTRRCIPSAALPSVDLEAPATTAQLSLAAQLAVRGRASLAANAFAEAIASLDAAFRLSGDVSLLGDLGFALQGALRIDEAWIALRRFKLEAPSVYATVSARVDAALSALQARLGAVNVSADVPNASLYYRGWLVGRLPLAAPVFVLPGDAVLTVRAPGLPEVRVTARVEIGAVASVDARLSVRGSVTGSVNGAVGGTLGAVGALPTVSLPSASLPDLSIEGPATQAHLDLAAQLAARGRASLAASAWLDAIASLEGAYRLSADASLLGDLGFALQGAGRIDLAWLLLRRFKLEAPTAYLAARARVDAALGALQAQLGGVMIDARAGAQVYYRGMLVARLPIAEPLFVLPGVAAFTVRAAGMLDARVSAEVAIGAVARVSAPLVAIPTPSVGAPNIGAPNVSAPNVSVPPVAPPAVRPPSVIPLVLGISGGVVGIGAIVGFVGFGVLAPRLQAPELMCPAMGGGSQSCLDIRAALDVWNVLRIAGSVVGGLTIGASIITYFVLKPALSARPPEVPAPNLQAPLCENGRCEAPRRMFAARPAPSLLFSCAPGPMGDAVGLGCFGRF